MVNNDNRFRNEMSQSDYDSLYRRFPGSNRSNKTVIVGSNGEDITYNKDVDQFAPQYDGVHEEATEKRIVGVMYSISKEIDGEIFPIYLGNNVIGSNPKCDIRLKEGTVSSEHAILYVMENEESKSGYDMSIADMQSDYGTKVNGNDVFYGNMYVKEDDLINIGRHYFLLVKLFNTRSHGMYVERNFVPLEDEDEEMMQIETLDADFYEKKLVNNGKQTVLYEDAQTKTNH